MPGAPDAGRSHKSERDPSESLSERRQKVLFPSLPLQPIFLALPLTALLSIPIDPSNLETATLF